MSSKKKMKSFERALFEGDICGPSWTVVNAETDEQVFPGDQDYGHTDLGRRVIDTQGYNLPVTVIDYQVPADKHTARQAGSSEPPRTNLSDIPLRDIISLEDLERHRTLSRPPIDPTVN
jgi:hypothetical protein